MSTAADLISATPGYSGFEQVRDGVFVGRGTQKDLVVLLDVDAGARGGSGCGGLSSGAHAERRRESAQIRDWWFLRALLDAVDRLPALRDATQLEVVLIGNPLDPEDAETVGAMADALDAVGALTREGTLDPLGLKLGSRARFVHSGFPTGPAWQRVNQQLLAYNVATSTAPPEVTDVNGAFQDLLRWEWHLPTGARHAVLGEAVVATVSSATMPIPGASSWRVELVDPTAPSAPIPAQPQSEDIRRHSRGPCSDWARALAPIREQLDRWRTGRRVSARIPDPRPHSRPEVLRWAIANAALDLPIQPRAANQVSRQLERLFDSQVGRPYFYFPALWTSGAADVDDRGLLLRDGPAIFWTELALCADSDPDATVCIVLHATACALLGSNFVRSCTLLRAHIANLFPNHGLVQSATRAALFVDAPSGKGASSKPSFERATSCLRLARLFGIQTWIDELEATFGADEGGGGFEVEESRKRLDARVRAKVRDLPATPAAVCEARARARELLFERMLERQIVQRIPRPGLSGDVSVGTILHACAFMLLLDSTAHPLSGRGAQVREAREGGAKGPEQRATPEADWEAEHRKHAERFGRWLHEIDEDERRRFERGWHEEGTELLGSYGGLDQGIVLNPGVIAAAAQLSPAGQSPGATVSSALGGGSLQPSLAVPGLASIQRFAAILMKVTFHELHHAIEELVIREYETGLMVPPPGLYAAWMKKYGSKGGPNCLNEALANADALDRCWWMLHQNGGTRLDHYASQHLLSRSNTIAAVDAVLDAFVQSAPGRYSEANAFRRTPWPPSAAPRSPASNWSGLPTPPGVQGGWPDPVDGSDYWYGVAYWLLNEVLVPPGFPGVTSAPTPPNPTSAAIAFERCRSAYEYCDHAYRVSLGSMRPDRKEALLTWLRYCADENLRLPARTGGGPSGTA